MSLSPKITVYPGTERQQNVGIMGRATLELQSGDTIVARFSNMQIRKTKEGKWWIQYPAEEDRNGKKDDNGYPVRYPYYVLFPGDGGRTSRAKLHDAIIKACQDKAGGGVQAQAAPVTSQPVQTPPPQAAAVPAQSDTDDLEWDL